MRDPPSAAHEPAVLEAVGTDLGIEHDVADRQVAQAERDRAEVERGDDQRVDRVDRRT